MALDPLWLSLQIATLATIVTLIVGVALAALLAWPKLPGRDLIDALVMSPMVLPPTVLGYYLLVAIGQDSAIGRAWQAVFDSRLTFNFAGAVVAATIGSLPFVVKNARTALEEVDPTLQQAARTLGAGPFRIFFTITLPLASRGVIAGAMLGFARALGDFGITLMIIGSRLPDGRSPISIYIYDQLNAGHDAVARNMAILVTAVAVVILYAVNRLTRRPRAG
jgi:molybdate transport system permease protein